MWPIKLQRQVEDFVSIAASLSEEKTRSGAPKIYDDTAEHGVVDLSTEHHSEIDMEGVATNSEHGSRCSNDHRPNDSKIGH